ncbi:MAG: hypothetical protein SLRJCFUN_000156 [Candidatus Fervidibacter sp.]
MGGRTSGEPQFLPDLPTCPSPDLPIMSVRQEPRPPKRHFSEHTPKQQRRGRRRVAHPRWSGYQPRRIKPMPLALAGGLCWTGFGSAFPSTCGSPEGFQPCLAFGEAFTDASMLR